MQIEAGKCYRDGFGRKVGPMEDRGGPEWRWRGYCQGYGTNFYRNDGTCSTVAKEASRGDLIAEWSEPAKTEEAPAVIAHPNYASLAGVLQAAHDHAARGKGHQRHGDDGKPFLDQPIMEIARMLGDTAGHSYQIMKKADEANRMIKRKEFNEAVAEYLGIINYAAAAILLIREL